MTKEEHNKIIDFVNSDDYMLLNSYISKPYEETIIEQDKEINRLNNIIEELDKLISIKIIREANEPDYHIDLNDMVEIKTKLLELKEESDKDD